VIKEEDMRRFSLAFFLLFSCVSFSADRDFNGRWDITAKDSDRKRAWWLEVSGAGTSSLSGMFVGAPGGQLDKLTAIKIENGQLEFSVKPDRVHKARLVNGKLEGTVAQTSWTGVRAPKLSPGDPKKHKEGTPVELFNGRDLTGWKPVVDGRPAWRVEDGLLRNGDGASDLVTDQKFWNFKLHAEYRIGPKSNSGIGLRGRYEIQIFDDNGAPPSAHGNGALYSRIAPVINASKPPGEWQVLDITLLGNQLSVILNEAKIIDRGEIHGLTAMAIDPNEAEPGPFVIQGDHGLVEFRRLTVTPLEKK